MMAQIDVTELFVDPEFTDAISIISRVPTVNAFGENSLAETTANTVGSVQPASDVTIRRLPESLRVANLSSFWVRGTITVTGTNKYPDILVFNGRRYQVQYVFDYTNWGAGWSEGVCVIEAPSGS